MTVENTSGIVFARLLVSRLAETSTRIQHVFAVLAGVVRRGASFLCDNPARIGASAEVPSGVGPVQHGVWSARCRRSPSSVVVRSPLDHVVAFLVSLVRRRLVRPRSVSLSSSAHPSGTRAHGHSGASGVFGVHPMVCWPAYPSSEPLCRGVLDGARGGAWPTGRVPVGASPGGPGQPERR